MKRTAVAVCTILAASLGLATTALAGKAASVKSVTFSGTEVEPTITVKGKNFGKAAPMPNYEPPGCPTHSSGRLYGQSFWYSGGSWAAGEGGPGEDENCIGIVVKSWKGGKIVFTFGNSYPCDSCGWVAAAGDAYTITVLGAKYSGIVSYGKSKEKSKKGVQEIAGGGYQSCAVLSSGDVNCWGSNEYGELGDGTTTSSDIPKEVKGVTNATLVAAALFHSCALLSTAHIECWGQNDAGQLGDGTDTGPETCTEYGVPCSTKPVEAVGISNASQIAAGFYHTCAVLSTGHVECWGYNSHGQLGNGDTTDSDTPVEVSGITNATQVTAGYYHSCARLSTGHVECWGYNEFGQLGNGSTTSSDTPVEVHGITNANSVAAGWQHSCAALSTGHIECWGANSAGELGNGSKTSSDTPVETQGITNATGVAAGAAQSCAALSSGHISCWGENASGQLGNGNTTSSDTPVEVSGISNGTQVAAGGYHSCALLSTGEVECWGNDEFGQLGNGSETNSDTPVAVAGT